ncbi:uncharacterized protein KY384_008429 [Bacidia gigantensis]|uniref:uncharacterized protein n=1 Tax=Bacidia gigantensis TaxID=2732470 RepID=UPI001D040723|nr:uncharacterized protein KY384_008429 [Bacidia gigantensis]KAG8527000.1 hypothetical protein KY384_008429 [Bacidia gigantensis]
MTAPLDKELGLNASSSQDMANKRPDFIQTHSIGASFSNMIAQAGPKPAKYQKTKSKKRPPEQATAQTNPFDKFNTPSNHFSLNQPQNHRPVTFGARQMQNQQWQMPLNPFNRSPYGPSSPLLSHQETMDYEPQVKQEPVEDDYSEEMELSSGSEAETPVAIFRPDGNLKHLPNDTSINLKPADTRKVNDLSDCMDLSSGPEAASGSPNETSVSPRESMTPFNDSAASSHTSTMLSNEAKVPPTESDRGEIFEDDQSPHSDTSTQLTSATSIRRSEFDLSNEHQKTSAGSRMPRRKKLNVSERPPKLAASESLASPTVAQQGIHAAYASRLNPFALHHEEYKFLKDHICHGQVTAYLNIRNRILRLWVRNPLVQVTAEEAVGCTSTSRWVGMAKFAYEWLVRRGYINFGCLEIPCPPDLRVKKYKLKRAKRKTIAIVGAGMAGLGCARQLEGLIHHYQERWTTAGEEPPNVILLEGRNRVGGRLYSHPLKNQNAQGIPDRHRCTAEMGAHIIIGFDHGNPLSMIIRGQLAVHYHTLRDNSSLYDIDGRVVDGQRDRMVEALYNDCLDRASAYRHRIPPPITVEGDRTLIEQGQDPGHVTGPSISEVEKENPNIPNIENHDGTESVPGGMDKLTGKAHMIMGPRKKEPPAVAAEAMGWKLGEHVLSYDDLNLDAVARSSENPTLGAAMDEAVKQYNFLLDLTPQDMRLINWHYANLEYANAANVGKLSLGGWDQDAGNEFEGRHAQVIGGYQQVPKAIYELPKKLDLRTRQTAKRIEYNIWSGNAKTPGAKIQLDGGDTIDADHVVLTSSLGVLKEDAIEFSPPLPPWKKGAINRLGFGLLNKCILVYDEPFWDIDQDMFGLLREPEDKECHDSTDQEDYVTNRGRFYFFWNCIKTSGRPVLISLLAGDAAYQVEDTSDAELVTEVTEELQKVFKNKNVPYPEECIITRWASDRFARGTYSYVGAESMPSDYNYMAARVNNLHFAGEATCATHPATVHGAYISGLRAASEIIDDLLGPIEISEPLVTSTTPVQAEPHSQYPVPPSQQPRPAETRVDEALKPYKPRLESFEAEIINAIHKTLGLKPQQPKTPRPNAWLLYTAEHWQAVKSTLGLENSSSMREKVRLAMGVQWKALSEEGKRPYIERTQKAKQEAQIEQLNYRKRVEDWDAQAIEIRRQYINDHPGVLTEQEEQEMWANLQQVL